MNIQMRIITEDNIDQLLNLSFSNNMQLLLDDDREISKVIQDFKKKNSDLLNADVQRQAGRLIIPEEKESTGEQKGQFSPHTPDEESGNKFIPSSPDGPPPPDDLETPPYEPTSPAYRPTSPDEAPLPGSGSPQYMPTSPAYRPSSPSGSPPNADSPQYNPNSSGSLEPRSPTVSPVRDTFAGEAPISRVNIRDDNVRDQFDALPEQQKSLLLKMVSKKTEELKEEAKAKEESPTAILNLEEEKSAEDESKSDEKSQSDKSAVKKVQFS
jgi:hypothetical protein